MVRDGFRLMVEDNNFKIEKIIKKSQVIQQIIYQDNVEIAKEHEWVIRSLKFVVMGISSPLVFLKELHEKFSQVKRWNFGSRSFRILNRGLYELREKEKETQ